MALGITCPHCSQFVEVPDDAPGKRFRCACGGEFTVDAPAPAPVVTRPSYAQRTTKRQVSIGRRGTTGPLRSAGRGGTTRARAPVGDPAGRRTDRKRGSSKRAPYLGPVLGIVVLGVVVFAGSFLSKRNPNPGGSSNEISRASEPRQNTALRSGWEPKKTEEDLERKQAEESARLEEEKQRIAKQEEEEKLRIAKQEEEEKTAHLSVVREWLDDQIAGGDGYRFWGPEYRSLASHLINVSSYRIERYFPPKKSDNNSGMIAAVQARVTSTNRGGQPILQTWTVSVIKPNYSEKWVIMFVGEGGLADNYSGW